MGNLVQMWKYDERIPSEPDNCAAIIELLLSNLERAEWQNKDVFGIHMAMEEAVMNAIRHGNQCSPDKDVHVIIKLSENEFYAQITDQGCGFDPDELPDPTDDDNLEKTCGRGVMLIRNFVDEVKYNEKGNSVELFKNRSQ